MPKTTASPVGSELTFGMRQFLYLTATLCGAAVLIVEILGAKMLSPFFGTSHFVWTAQIAVTLLSLACGYWFGGWLVDRAPNLRRLYTCIVVAAAYLCLTVPLCRPVAEACLNFKLALGSLLSSLFLFFVPLALLATVGPFLVRVMTASVKVVGGQMGRVNALSTFGSVFGAVLIGYLLIPFLPNSVTMYVTAAFLLLLAASYFAVFARRAGSTSFCLLVAGLGGGLSYQGYQVNSHPHLPDMEQLARRNSNFGLMQVLKDTGQPRLYYVNDYLYQNGYDTSRHQSVHLFTYMLHGLSHAYTPKIDLALCIGMGVGIVPMEFAKEGIQVDIVEINPAVVPLAERYFEFKPDKVHLFYDDGRHFLNVRTQQYDTIVLDAFLGDSSPSHLMTREAFTAMKEALNPGGTLVINSFGDLTYGNDYYTASLERTLRAVFRSVKMHAAGLSGNIFFVASDQPKLTILHPPSWKDVHPDVLDRMKLAFRNEVGTNPRHGRVLTDDFNPVEFYDAENRERIRKSLALSMTAADR